MSPTALMSLFDAAASLAIVGSLFAIFFQIREGTKAAKSAAYQQVVASMRDTAAIVIQTEESGIFVRGREDLSSLNERERHVFNELMHNYLNDFESLYYQVNLGLVDHPLWVGWLNWLIEDVMRRPGVRDWWEIEGPLYWKPFQSVIDQALADSP